MRDLLTKDYFETLSFIPTLLRYFTLSPDNRVTCNGMFPKVKITYYRDTEGRFHRVVDLGYTEDDYEPADFFDPMELDTIEAIIYQLEDLPSTMEGFSFKNMKEQVRAISTAYSGFGMY